MVQRVEPNITHRCPNLTSVKELIYKRVFGNVVEPGYVEVHPVVANRIFGKASG